MCRYLNNDEKYINKNYLINKINFSNNYLNNKINKPPYINNKLKSKEMIKNFLKLSPIEKHNSSVGNDIYNGITKHNNQLKIHKNSFKNKINLKFLSLKQNK